MVVDRFRNEDKKKNFKTCLYKSDIVWIIAPGCGKVYKK